MSYGVEISLEKIDHKVIIRIIGRLDAVSCPQVERRIRSLLEEKQIHLLLDFSQVEYMSSAGLRFLLSFTKQIHSLKGTFVLFSVPIEVMRIIRMAGFEKLIPICKTEQEALQYHG